MLDFIRLIDPFKEKDSRAALYFGAVIDDIVPSAIIRYCGVIEESPL